MRQQQQSPEISDGVQSCMSKDNESLGGLIGKNYPFGLAYVQPVIRASPYAQPEQPFPPAQLGRDMALHDSSSLNSIAGSTTGVKFVEDEIYDDAASVRVQHCNQNDRRQLNRRWKDQMARYENERLFYIVIGEECGTMACDEQGREATPSYHVLV